MQYLSLGESTRNQPARVSQSLGSVHALFGARCPGLLFSPGNLFPLQLSVSWLLFKHLFFRV